jgi:hypothetical protein
MVAANVTLTADQESSLREQVVEHRDEAIRSRGDFPSRHSERYRRYLADPALRPPGPWPDAPRLFISLTRYVHEKLMADLWQTLFGVDANLRLVPFGEEDAQGALWATRFLRWALREMSDFGTASETGLFDALLDSAGVYKVVGWKPPWKAPTSARGFFDRIVRIDPLDMGMLLIPPDATGLQYPECLYVGQEFHFRKDDLVRMKKERQRGKTVYDIPDPDEFKPTEQQPTERQQTEQEREGTAGRPFHKDTYLFVEQYERFVVDEREGLEEDVIVSWFPDAQAGDGTKTGKGKLARVRKLIDVFPQDDRPRRPFFDITVWPQPRQWRGMNVPDRLESMQDLINRLHEQMVNYGDVSILPYIFANTFLTGDLPDLRQVRPGSTVPVEDVNGVQFAPTRSLNRHFAEQIQLAFSNVERDTSVTDFNLGRQSDRPNAPRTASATLALLGESRKAFGMHARHVARQYQRMLTFYFRMWQDILPQRFTAPLQPADDRENVSDNTRDILSRLFDGEIGGRNVAVTLSREQLSGIFDAALDINPEAQFDRQVLLSLAQLLLPVTQNYALGQRELMKRVWEAFDQKGFEQIWPMRVAATTTQIQTLTQQLQLEQIRAQLQQIQAAQAQAEAQQQQIEAEQAALAQRPPTETPVARSILDALSRSQQATANGEGQPPV